MHGLINRSIQCFLRDTYGQPRWIEIAAAADLGFDCFEPLMDYDDALTTRVIDAGSKILSKPDDAILEDLGTYLASHKNLEPVRRLLRFGGETFVEFLHSLDELRGRALLAVPELLLPVLRLQSHSQGNFTLTCRYDFHGHGHVLVGVLRAMADDYGTLALIDHLGGSGGVETISVQLLKSEFTQGRSFELSGGLQ